MNLDVYNQLVEVYMKHFDTAPEIGVRAPGRINLIGEHTDYNMGFVMPGAIDKAIYICASENHTNQHQWTAIDLKESISIPVNQKEKTKYEWADFILGGLIKMEERGADIKGLNIAFNSDLPIGAGLSSSSALSCGMIFMANELLNLQFSNLEIALLGHKSEREFIGLNGGIMDQFASVLGQKDRFLLLDCRSQDLEPIQMPNSEHSLMLINSCVQHTLTDSDYNTRSKESNEAYKVVAQHFPNVHSLRDVNEEMIDQVSSELGRIGEKRARYVVKENERVLRTVEALRSNNIELVGRLLFESHNGLQHEYEVSCEELDFLVDFAKDFDGVAGARMMGGGFGGCTINLVHKSKIDSFKDKINLAYKERFGIDPVFIPFTLTDGTSVINP